MNGLGMAASVLAVALTGMHCGTALVGMEVLQ